MRKEIYSAFDSVHASRELKDRTRAFTARRQASRPRSPRRWVAAVAAACLLLAAAGIGGHWLYFTPTAAISIDVNPSLELEVNRFDRVIGVEGYNEDGRALAALVDVTFQRYDQAVEEILNSETVTALLARDEVVTITVTGSDTAQCHRLLSGVEGETAGQPNVHCHSANHDQVEQAHEHGLSYGKYQAYLELRALDPDLTPEDVADMTMGRSGICCGPCPGRARTAGRTDGERAITARSTTRKAPGKPTPASKAALRARAREMALRAAETRETGTAPRAPAATDTEGEAGPPTALSAHGISKKLVGIPFFMGLPPTFLWLSFLNAPTGADLFALRPRYFFLPASFCRLMTFRRTNSSRSFSSSASVIIRMVESKLGMTIFFKALARFCDFLMASARR